MIDALTYTITTYVPFGHHTLGIECKGVLSTGVDRMLFGNRVGVTLAHLFLFKLPTTGVKKTILMVESPCSGDWASLALPGMTNPTDQVGYLSQAQ